MANTEALLLDTHTFLWAIFDPDRLSRAVRRWLVNPDVILHLSVASVWEIELKHSKGKLNADASTVDANARELGIRSLPITVPHVRALATLARPGYKDPFDRLIAAQAAVENLPLVTADSAFAEYPQIEIRW
ncbi:MAG: type II toxin-antitoxin system VapC family toxin [Acidobacteriaceae bacterium]|nr:type II toxin-antitoxin system VapC family toxin [Acidobacteriaceae bacterium]